MTAFQVVFALICAIGGGAGVTALLRAPSQNRRDQAHSADVLVDAAVDVSELQRSTITELRSRLEAAERRAAEAEARALTAERRAAALSRRVAQLEETVGGLLDRRNP